MRTHNIFFTSDLHLCHSLMMRERGFETLDEMNETLIANWNNVVTPRDEVYLLGDVSFGSLHDTEQILKQLKGRIHLIRGNHDDKLDPLFHYFESVHDLLSISVYDNEIQQKQRIALCHFPFESWRGSNRQSWHLHGHTHGHLRKREGYKRDDVGVDSWNLTPAKYEEIKEKFSSDFYKRAAEGLI